MTYGCLLCGRIDGDVRVGLVAWAEPIGDRVFDAIPRCSDRVACRARVEDENHEPWPLVDATRETWDDGRDRSSTLGPSRPDEKADFVETTPGTGPQPSPAHELAVGATPLADELVEEVAWLP
jgi:hypothetical protein